MDITVTVLAKHIIGADVSSPYDCPIARAVHEQFPDANVVIGYCTAEVDGHRYLLGAKATRWIADAMGHDHSALVPSTFTLTEVK